jgi:hypothetical protein
MIKTVQAFVMIAGATMSDKALKGLGSGDIDGGS